MRRGDGGLVRRVGRGRDTSMLCTWPLRIDSTLLSVGGAQILRVRSPTSANTYCSDRPVRLGSEHDIASWSWRWMLRTVVERYDRYPRSKYLLTLRGVAVGAICHWQNAVPSCTISRKVTVHICMRLCMNGSEDMFVQCPAILSGDVELIR